MCVEKETYEMKKNKYTENENIHTIDKKTHRIAKSINLIQTIYRKHNHNKDKRISTKTNHTINYNNHNNPYI